MIYVAGKLCQKLALALSLFIVCGRILVTRKMRIYYITSRGRK